MHTTSDNTTFHNTTLDRATVNVGTAGDITLEHAACRTATGAHTTDERTAVVRGPAVSVQDSRPAAWRRQRVRRIRGHLRWRATTARAHRAPRRGMVGRRRRTARFATLTSVLVATAAAALGCTSDTTLSGGSPARLNKNSTPATASTTPPVTLGDLGKYYAEAIGAPYDPCEVVSWNDLPDSVRPDHPDARPPKSMDRPPPGSSVAIACGWENSDEVVIGGPSQPATEPTTFTVWVGWGGDDITTADPTRITGSQPATYGDTPGAIRPVAPTAEQDPACAGWADLDNGIASVIVVNSRFDIDSCEVVTTLLTTIANEHG